MEACGVLVSNIVYSARSIAVGAFSMSRVPQFAVRLQWQRSYDFRLIVDKKNSFHFSIIPRMMFASGMSPFRGISCRDKSCQDFLRGCFHYCIVVYIVREQLRKKCSTEMISRKRINLIPFWLCFYAAEGYLPRRGKAPSILLLSFFLMVVR